VCVSLWDLVVEIWSSCVLRNGVFSLIMGFVIAWIFFFFLVLEEIEVFERPLNTLNLMFKPIFRLVT
jgi:hypothetical protein